MKSDSEVVLIFSDWYLPGYKAGGPIRSCANLVELLGDEINFKVVCGDRDYLETEPYPNVLVNEWVKVGKAKVMYLPPKSQSLSKIRSIIKAVNPSVIYLNGMFSVHFTVFPLLISKRADAKVIVAPRGMLAEAAMKIRNVKKNLFLKLSKSIGLFSNVEFHATNITEENQIKNHFAESAVSIVENIPGFPDFEHSRENHQKEKNSLHLYTVARIAPEKNILFGLECLNQVDPLISVNLDIIGPVYDKQYFHKCERVVSTLPEHVKVRFLGALPQSKILQIAARADFFFLPTAGENYGHAIAESLMIGIPAIISTRTPWRNLRKARLGFDLSLDQKKFSGILNEVGTWGSHEYYAAYKNIRVSAEALINVNKLRTGYTNLFDHRNRS